MLVPRRRPLAVVSCEEQMSIKSSRIQSVPPKRQRYFYERLRSLVVMLPEIELDILQCFDRSSLETLQMHSRYLRDTVNRHARSLPLRYIQEVCVSVSGVCLNSLKK